MRKKLLVVAALLEKDKLILVARRRQGKSMGGLWEFPGGKIESGETPEQALERELREELNLETRTGAHFETVFHSYPDFDIELIAYWSTWVSGQIQLKDHDEARFVARVELTQLEMAPADVPLIKKLASELL